jgi:hypothetical protein
MGNQKLYQPTAEELDALWEKGNRRDMPCDNPGCVPCMQLHGRRLAALNQILKHAQQLQAQSQSPSVFVGSGSEAECAFCHKKTLLSTAHLYQGMWVGDCCWDERLRTTE